MDNKQLKIRVDKIRQDAEDAFWEVVAKSCPEIKTGDFDAYSTIMFKLACEQAIGTWIIQNTPQDLDKKE